MAAGTGGVGTVLGQPFTDRKALTYAGVLFESRNLPGRRWWRDAEKIIQDPLAPYYRRGSGGIGSHRQNASLAQQPASPAVFVQRDAPEAAAVHMRNAVMLRQPFVDKRIIRAQQVEHTPILAHDAFKKEFRLLTKGLPEIVIEVRKQTHVRSDRCQIAQVQPLSAKVRHQSARTGVGEHSTRLSFEHSGFFEFSRNGGIQQLIVRNTAPQEEGQARSQFQIADPIGGIRRDAGRVSFDSEQKLGAHQERGQGHFDARVKVSIRPRFAVKLKRFLKVRIGNRPPIGPSHQGRKDVFGAAFFLARPRRTARKNPLAAGRVTRTLHFIRTDDRDRVDCRLESRMPVDIEVSLVGLARSFKERRRLFQKCHADGVRSGLHRNADLEELVEGVVAWLILFRVFTIALGRLHREQLHPLPVEQQLHFVGLAQALDVLVAVPRQPNLDLVLGVKRERIRDQRSAARAYRKPIYVLLLGEVRLYSDSIAAWRTAGTSHRQPADLLRRRYIAIQ